MRIKRAYGECARSGKRVPLDELVEDGDIEGLLVAKDWYEPEHPLDNDLEIDDEHHEVPAPELSTPEGEGTAAASIGFDAAGNLTFT